MVISSSPDGDILRTQWISYSVHQRLPPASMFNPWAACASRVRQPSRKFPSRSNTTIGTSLRLYTYTLSSASTATAATHPSSMPAGSRGQSPAYSYTKSPDPTLMV